jgi:hypothetical protein
VIAQRKLRTTTARRNGKPFSICEGKQFAQLVGTSWRNHDIRFNAVYSVCSAPCGYNISAKRIRNSPYWWGKAFCGHDEVWRTAKSTRLRPRER